MTSLAYIGDHTGLNVSKTLVRCVVLGGLVLLSMVLPWWMIVLPVALLAVSGHPEHLLTALFVDILYPMPLFGWETEFTVTYIFLTMYALHLLIWTPPRTRGAL